MIFAFKTKLATVVALSSILVACGGGGGDGSSSVSDTDSAGTPPSSTSASYWTMDGYKYLNGGDSVGSTVPSPTPSDTRMIGIRTVSTTAVNPDLSNGVFSGGTVQVVYVANGAGTYTVLPSMDALLAATGTSNAVAIQSLVGTYQSTGSTVYSATGGTVDITFDAAGKPHFSSEGALSTTKTQDLNDGVPSAPSSMKLTLANVY